MILCKAAKSSSYSTVQFHGQVVLVDVLLWCRTEAMSKACPTTEEGEQKPEQLHDGAAFAVDLPVPIGTLNTIHQSWGSYSLAALQ